MDGKPPERKAVGVRLRLRFLLAGLFILPIVGFAQTPTYYPTWWAGYGVLTGTARADYAAANQGQAKNLAVEAVYELDSDLAQFGGAGSALHALAVALSATSAQTEDYAAVNLGELKALSQPFFNRLLAVGYTEAPVTSGTYPWAAPGAGTPSDYASGNIGQLKFLFSFDVKRSGDGSGIPDWWEKAFFPGQTMDPTGYSSSDGLTNIENYLDGINPTVQLQVNVIVQ
jgi:hypothetical protein